MKQETRNHKLKTHIVRVLARTKLLTSSHVAGHRSKNRIGFQKSQFNNSTIQQFNNSRLSRFARGQVIILPLILLVIVMIISTTMFSRVIMFLQSGSRAVAWEQATSLADAGADYAVWQLNLSSTYAGNETKAIGTTGEFQVGAVTAAGSNKKITSTGCTPTFANCKIKRVVKVEVTSAGINIPFPYAVHGGPEGIDMGPSGKKVVIRGNVFSNGPITDESCDDSIPNCIIYGDAFATGEIDAPPISVVPGPKHAFYSPAVPLPTIDESLWEAQALSGGLTSCPNVSGCNITNQTNYLLGPRKFDASSGIGNLTITNSSVIVKGTVHITGELKIEGSTIKLDDSLGSQGTIIIINGQLTIFQGSQVLANSATPKGYIVFYSKGQSGQTVVRIEYNKPHEAIYYNKVGKDAQVEGYVSPLICNHSAIPPILARLTGAILGDSPQVRGCLEVLDANLSLATFSPGSDSGASWQIRRGTYKITVN